MDRDPSYKRSVQAYIDDRHQRQDARSTRRTRGIAGGLALFVAGTVAGISTGVLPGTYCTPVKEFGSYLPPGCTQVDARTQPKPIYTRPTTAPATNRSVNRG